MSMYSDETTYLLKGTRITGTDKAVLFKVDTVNDVPLDESVTKWFPFSQITTSMTDPLSKGEDTIRCKAWIVKQNNLI